MIRNESNTSYPRNSFSLKRDQINRWLFPLTLLLLLFILPLGFLNEKAGRVTFYWCSYLSAAGILLNIRAFKSMLAASKMAVAGFSLALLFTLWSLAALYLSVPGEENGILLTPAKRWFLASLIALYIAWSARQNIISKTVLYRLVWASLLAAFLLSSAYGIWQHLNGVVRITLGINRATMSAYAFSAMSLATIAMLSQIPSLKIKYFSVILSSLLSVYITFLSETRSAMVIHTLLALLLLLNILWCDKKLKLIPVLFIIASVVAVLGLNRDIINTRLETTRLELSRYQQGNDNTSLGSRFTLWKMGLVTFAENPLGETQITRNTIILERLADIKPKPYALSFINVHLHNEFIQYASLFGIFGVLMLAYFYITMIFFNGMKTSFINPVTIMTLSALLYGMTDVLLTSIEYVVLLTTSLTLANLYNIKLTSQQSAPRES